MICTFSAFLARPAVAIRRASSRASACWLEFTSTTLAPLPRAARASLTRSSIGRFDVRERFWSSALLVVADIPIVVPFVHAAAGHPRDVCARHESLWPGRYLSGLPPGSGRGRLGASVPRQYGGLLIAGRRPRGPGIALPGPARRSCGHGHRQACQGPPGGLLFPQRRSLRLDPGEPTWRPERALGGEPRSIASRV